MLKLSVEKFSYRSTPAALLWEPGYWPKGLVAEWLDPDDVSVAIDALIELAAYSDKGQLLSEIQSPNIHCISSGDVARLLVSEYPRIDHWSTN